MLETLDNEAARAAARDAVEVGTAGKNLLEGDVPRLDGGDPYWRDEDEL